MKMLTHGRITLALHTLKEGPGPQLLALHGLAESAAAIDQAVIDGWPGAVFALDFTGHGHSDVPVGGGYTCEVVMGDADAALAEIGAATVYGQGLGAYIGLLIAGARPQLVRGLIMADGPGLAGGGIRPGSTHIVSPTIDATAPQGSPDPFALLDLSTDVRPPDYGRTFAQVYVQQSGLDPAVIVTNRVRPPWLRSVLEEFGVEEGSLERALAEFSV